MRPSTLNRIIVGIAVVVPFLGLLLAIYLCWQRYVFMSDIALLVGMYTVTAFGVTIGYHRMLTHDGFQAPSWVRGIFLILGAMAFTGSKPEAWAATHICHHAHSDEEGDPHSPLEGFWHAHIGWMFDIDSYSNVKQYAPHMLEDPVIMFVSRYILVWGTLAFLIPFMLGGWTGLLWGGVVRLFVTTHATWSVNSICHTFGRRAFETTDESRNEWLVGLLAFGEGWHNNHHAFPRNAFHGMQWWQFDLSGILIRAMEKVGLVWDVQRVSAETIHAQRIQAEKSKATLAALRAQVLDAAQNADRDLQSFFGSAIALSISDPEAAKVRDAQLRAIKRIREIRTYVDKASHLKKQKLMAYMNELQQLTAAVHAAKPLALARA